MQKEKWESKIIDYIDGRLNDEDRVTLEGELSRNGQLFQLYEQMREVIGAMERSERLNPSERMRGSFEKILAEESARLPTTKTVIFRPAVYRIAAAIAFVLSGVAIGMWLTNQRNEEMLALKQEVETTKLLMQSMLANENSASQRIAGVNVALKMNKADDEVVHALVKAMNEDANSNVRLAALQALSTFQNEPAVRSALIESLSTQKDVVVQIALIQLLVKMKEKSVLKSLEDIVDDNQTIQAVKDEAYTGILKLS